MLHLSTFLTGLLVSVAHAQSPWLKYQAPLGAGNFGVQFVNIFSIRAINFILFIFTGSMVVAMMYGGFMMVISHGSDDGKEKAKKVFIFAVSGLILAVIAFSLLSFVASTVITIVS